MSHLVEYALQVDPEAGPFTEWIVALDLTAQRLKALCVRMPALLGPRAKPPKEVRKFCFGLALDIEHWRRDYFRIASAQNPARYTAGYFMDIFGGHIFHAVREKRFRDYVVNEVTGRRERVYHEYGDEVALEVVERVREYVIALSQGAQFNADYTIR